MTRTITLLTVALATLLLPCSALGDEDQIQNLEEKAAGLTNKLMQKLDADSRVEFEHTGQLPDAIFQLPKLGNIINDFEKLRASIRKQRGALAKQGLTPGHQDFQRLNDIDRQVDRVLGHPNQFAPGSLWKGTLQQPQGAIEIELQITKSNGPRFSGEILERGLFGRATRMKVTGRVQQGQLVMETGAMVLGAPRYRQYAGLALNNRIVANVGGAEQHRKGIARSGGIIDLQRISN